MIGGKKIAANTFFLSASSIVNLGISLVTTSLIAKSIGAELYGRYSFGLNFILLFSVLANFGLISLFVRDVACGKRDAKVIKDILWLKFILGFLTIGTIVVSTIVLDYQPETRQVIYILCGGLFFQILYETLLAVYQALEKMHTMAALSVGFRVICGIVVVFSIYSGIGFLGIVFAFSIGNFLIFCITLAMVWRLLKLGAASVHPEIWKELVTAGLPFYLSALLTMTYAKINVIILSKMVSERDLGFFFAASNLVESLYFLPAAFNAAIFPAFSRLHAESFAALRSTYVKVTKYLVIVSTGVATGTVLVGERIVFIIYGGEFGFTAVILNVLIFFWVATLFSQAQSMLLFSIKKEREQAVIMGVGCFVSIFSNIVLIRYWGIIGAAYSAVITESVVVLMISIVLWKSRLTFSMPVGVLGVSVGIVGMIGVVKLLLEANTFLAIAGGGLTYIGLLFVLKGFDSEDISYIRSLIRRPT